jgi:hypothetical protein
MIRCLNEKQLWELYEAGESTLERAYGRAHLDSCDACQWHYQHLVRDLELIGQVLQEATNLSRDTVQIQGVTKSPPLPLAS